MAKPIGGRVCVTPLANACVCRERSEHKSAPKVARLSQTARGMRCISPLAERTQCANAANARFINPYRKRRLHFQNEMVFAEIDKAFVTHFAQFRRQPTALDSEIIRKLLS